MAIGRIIAATAKGNCEIYKRCLLKAKYHEKHKPAKFDKKQQLEKIRAEYLKKKQKQTDK